MAAYSKDGLGQVVRDLRERQGWTQEALGRAAGYQTGAGVSISRLESGLLLPSPERLAGVAAALGLTTDELEARASSPPKTDEPGRAAAAAADAGGASRSGASGRAKAPPGQKELNARRQMIELEIAERTRAITQLGDAFNEAHERARRAFFMKLVEIAGRVDGAPSVDPGELGDDDGTGADEAAIDRRGSGGRAGARAPSPGAADAASAAAERRAGGAAAGRPSRGRAAGVTGRTMVLAGIVAVPFGALVAGGLAYMVKRNRTQRQEFDAQLDEAEAQLAATRPGIAALQDALPRAVETLDYIATHAGHAVDRWEERLPPGSTSWESLSRAEKRRYHDFVDIATAQIAIVNVDFQGLLISRGPEQDHLIQLADRVLTHSRDVVTSHV